MSRPIYIKAPARICLFGDHQDYLGLPVIACSIARFINLKAVVNKHQKLYIKLPNINSERIIEVSENFENLKKGDHFAAALRLSLIHISEPTRLRRISYAVFCLKKKKSRSDFSRGK